ncbi:MAG: Ig-like domain-containing protein [Paludibacter sp.]|jgi:pectin methylesterase-like acyl-CoA thioesterase|nr:Ig-like domain-containing protein [Paludibacter sp.]
MKKLFLFFIIGLISNFIFADERLLVNETFQGFSVASTTTETQVTRTTAFTNETLVYKFREILANGSIDESKFNFNLASAGWLMAAKTATPYIELSPLASITKVEFIHGATGGSRGFQLWKKSATDADWVSVSSSYANPAQGVLVIVNINESNVALKFTNLNSSQNAYLFDLRIYGNYTSTAPQQTLATSVSPETAGSITILPAGNIYDQDTPITLTANKNFGYDFTAWQSNGVVVSTDNPFTFPISQDTVLTAVFSPVATYELTLSVEGGAKDYMLQPSPVGTLVDGHRMYETGTVVELTASSNPILTFLNWENQNSNSVRNITMTENKDISAVYSAADYVAGWDFYVAGNNGRVADFYANADNQTSALVLRRENGSTNAWLDKSTVAAGGYEGRPAAVNWKDLADRYYYQLSFNATEFTDMSIRSAMLYNYNTYSKQKVEYSLNGTDFTQIGQFNMTTEKFWYDSVFTLPAAANNAPVVYIRWIPDYTSPVLGSSGTNDGAALSGIYIFGSQALANDGVAPVFVSSIPGNTASGVSASGKIILTFDEKVKVAPGTTATLGALTLTPSVTGKTISFAYSGLNYNTTYSFNLPANSVADLTDNYLTTAIPLTFTTMDKPTVTPAQYNYVVQPGSIADLKAALTAANANNSGERYRIFIPAGTYDFGSQILTPISRSKISLIGAGAGQTIIKNLPPKEGIGETAIFLITGTDTYMQDLTLKSDYPYNNTTGRAVVLQDKGNKTILKNVKMLSYQDTYYSNNNNMRSYLEDCEIHGVVDFICGGGDVFFQRNLIYLEARNGNGNVIVAPNGNSSWGYVFNDCVIDGAAQNNGTYYLGRPWNNSPRAVYLNTTMKVLPTAEGWTNMGPLPALFAEYNSHTESGSPVDCSNRKTIYTVNNASAQYTGPTVLTDELAANYTLRNVLSGSDNWMPDLQTEGAPVPVISFVGSAIPEELGQLSWENSDYVLCWVIFKDGNFVAQTTENQYNIHMGAAGVYTVRAANEMGGLSASSNSIQVELTGIDNPTNNAKIVSQHFFTVDGREIHQPQSFNGVVIVKTIYSNGEITTHKEVMVK